MLMKNGLGMSLVYKQNRQIFLGVNYFYISVYFSYLLWTDALLCIDARNGVY